MTRDLIPHTKHVLENGLELILHEDHACPVVSVYVYYHVGSSREEPGRSGFAHLFEHMLFQGSEHVDDNGHFRLIQGAGGTLNGTTGQDRTNYYETLPANQLELALWLESDRMGFLLPAMNQAKLDNQRDVVSNERRQSYENRPYGLVHETILRHLYPSGHPYSWPTIGSMADIAAADLEAVSHFFRRWYGPNNATLVIGGDFDPKQARAWVQGYFGRIPRGPEVSLPPACGAQLTATKSIVIEDRVQIPQLTLVWPTVPAWHADEAALDLLLDALSANKCSLLDATLELGEELVTSISASHYGAERAGSLTLNLRPNPGISLERIRARLDELLEDFVRLGIDPGRIQRLKARRKAGLLCSMESVAQRCSWLGIDNCLSADPGRMRERFERLEQVQLEDVLDVARRYLIDQPRLLLSVVPKGQRDLALPGAHFDDGSQLAQCAAPNATLPEQPREPDPQPRDRVPAAGLAPAFVSPSVWRARLPNGIEILGSQADRIPLSRLTISLPAGRLSEPIDKLGISVLTARLLEEGTASLSSTQLIDELDGLGGQLSASAGEDEIVLSLSVLDEHIERGVQLLLEVLVSPRFAPEDFERIQRQLLLDQETSRDHASNLANDGFRALLFGAGPKGASSLGNPDAVRSITRQDLSDHWSQRSRSSAARVAYVGGLGRERVLALFGQLGRLRVREPAAGGLQSSWAAGGPAGRIHLQDMPGAQLSELRIGHPSIARSDARWFPLFVMNYILGGSFTSRLNLNLREDKGYTYGIRSGFEAGLSQGSFVVSCAVDTRVTAAAVREILNELKLIQGGISHEEAEFARSALMQSLLRTFESPDALLSSLQSIGKYGWADDYPAQRLAWLLEMRVEELSDLARQQLFPDQLYLMIVGDRAKIEADLLNLKLGQVVVW